MALLLVTDNAAWQVAVIILGGMAGFALYRNTADPKQSGQRAANAQLFLEEGLTRMRHAL